MPPFERRWPGFGSPFCALSVAVDLDDGGIDHGVFHVGIREGIVIIDPVVHDAGIRETAPVTEPECR